MSGVAAFLVTLVCGGVLLYCWLVALGRRR